MTSSSNSKNGSEETTTSVGDLKYYIRQLEAKLSLYDEVEEEKEQLKNQLADLSAWMKNEINKQKAMFSRLTDGLEEVWSIYQSTKSDLDRNQCELETSQTKILELKEKNAKLQDKTKQLQRQNERLEEKLQCRENSLCNKLADNDAIKTASDEQNACLEHQPEEIERTERRLEQIHSKWKSELTILKDKFDLQLQMADAKRRQHELEWILADERRSADKRVATVNGKVAKCHQVSERMKGRRDKMNKLVQGLHNKLPEPVKLNDENNVNVKKIDRSLGQLKEKKVKTREALATESLINLAYILIFINCAAVVIRNIGLSE
ncbi:golgin subfamily A member 6-like protein 1 [Adelges cooleyi]|uniref:golgin subfamily A member 6-like protein 1 n=1 Tax=Adelges cooleyi TaxID=133065 RepID=UPI0021805B63|nr:golgin subfamily A member 6-like protein 1 [Adelges cooleyi]